MRDMGAIAVLTYNLKSYYNQTFTILSHNTWYNQQATFDDQDSLTTTLIPYTRKIKAVLCPSLVRRYGGYMGY